MSNPWQMGISVYDSSIQDVSNKFQSRMVRNDRCLSRHLSLLQGKDHINVVIQTYIYFTLPISQKKIY